VLYEYAVMFCVTGNTVLYQLSQSVQGRLRQHEKNYRKMSSASAS